MEERIRTKVGGLSVIIKSTMLNLILYKEVTGKVLIRATKRARERRGVEVFLQNTYFAEQLSPGSTETLPSLAFKTTKRAPETDGARFCESSR